MAMKVELSWDCPYCDSKGIMGRFRECPNCGRTRSKDTKFYLLNGKGSKGNIIGAAFGHNIVDESTLKSTNPDWFCDSCDSYNPDSVDICQSCGAPRHKGTQNYAKLNQGKSDLSESAKSAIRNGFRRSTSSEDTKQEQIISVPWGEKFKQWFAKNKINVKHGGLVTISILLAIIVVVGLILLFSQKTTITVQELHWKYSVDVEVYKEFRESDWSVPSGGEVAYTRQEVHHYDTVLDHYETVYVDRSETYIDHYETVAIQHSETYIDHYDTYYEYSGDDGNGYGSVREISTPVYSTRYWTEYEQQPVYQTRYWQEEQQEPVYRQDPVYRTKYYYDIWRWVYDRTVTNQGQVSEEPTFPNPILGEEERLGSKYKQYWVVASLENGELKSYETSEEIWEQIQIGDKLIVGKFSSSISELKRAGE